MREYSTPRTAPGPVRGNLSDDVVHNAAEHPASITLSRRTDPDQRRGGWEDVSAVAFRDEVATVAKGLIAAGVEAGDRVALISRTRWEWTLLDYAVWFAGAVTVPVYPTSSAEQVRHILADCGARAVVVETQRHQASVAEARADLTELRHVWSLADDALDVLRRLGGDISDEVVEERRRAAGPDDVATIIYTSGTTGTPKGCELTHGNFMAALDTSLEALGDLFAPLDPQERLGADPEQGDAGHPGAGAGSGDEHAATLLFLPLAHVLARVIQVGSIRSRTRLAHSCDVTHLTEDLRAVRPTFLLAVPRVFEKLFSKASQEATADGRGPAFEKATDTAIAWSRAQDRGRPSVALRARHAAYSRLVYRRLRHALGGRCRYAVSGGAPLGERLGHFYRGIGLTVLEGYGLTETAGPVTVNVPGAVKIGTVGRPLPGTAVRIADDGELLFRGHQVFRGYHHDPDGTAEVLELDGWLHTGDVGEVDDEGFVRVTGRMKEILVTAGGKNVAPAVLEDLVRAHPLVSQCLVVGDRQPFVAALVTLDRESLAAWAVQRGAKGDPADLADHPALLAEVQAAVDAANSAVSKAEAIRRFKVLPEDWTEDDGLLTPSLKLRRTVVMRRFREEIADLYRS